MPAIDRSITIDCRYTLTSGFGPIFWFVALLAWFTFGNSGPITQGTYSPRHAITQSPPPTPDTVDSSSFLFLRQGPEFIRNRINTAEDHTAAYLLLFLHIQNCLQISHLRLRGMFGD